MASLWFHLSTTDVYVTFSSFEEAYYKAIRLFPTYCNYLSCVEHLMTHSMANIGADRDLQVYIYYGKAQPPIKKEWYPHGLHHVSVSYILNHPEYTRRVAERKKKQPVQQLKGLTKKLSYENLSVIFTAEHQQ
jgi:hypothetical protein